MYFFLPLFLLIFPLTCAEKIEVESKDRGQAEIEVYFSPEDQIDTKLIALIEKEKKSIYAAVYCLTHKDIIEALVAAKKRGVVVEMIIDPFSARLRTKLSSCVKAGIPVLVWNPEKKGTLMHDKFCVFGEEIIWTGSFNFTYQASQFNQENVVVLYNKTLAKKYLERFRLIKQDKCSPLRS